MLAPMLQLRRLAEPDASGDTAGMGPGTYFLNPQQERCVRCGEVARGSAQINGERLCHSGEPYPTCYMLETWERSAAGTLPVNRPPF